MRRNLDWQQGAPDKLEAGMVVQWDQGMVSLIGHIDADMAWSNATSVGDYSKWKESIIRWGWAIKPHELEWIEKMINRSGKGRGEE